LKKRVTVIDYGAGNLSSICNALRSLGAEVYVTDKPMDLLYAQMLVLPGVGSFGFLSDSLKEKGLMGPLSAAIYKGVPFLGICLGMQILFETSQESPGKTGLGVMKGAVVKFRKGKIPQLGWNKVFTTSSNGRVLKDGYGYFANSYKVVCNDDDNVLAITDYGGDFPSAVQKENVLGVQFHPEKSGPWGLEILERWLKC
jgi:imidazole glycerol phosphate synthase glutamine amidotransferase subunit